jgi:hypothetical protein
VIAALAVAALALWLVAVPWHVEVNGERRVQTYALGEEPPARISLVRIAWQRYLMTGVAALSVIIVTWLVIRHEVRCLRWNRGRCWTCGYDRRGLPHKRQCPECGASDDWKANGRYWT